MAKKKTIATKARQQNRQTKRIKKAKDTNLFRLIFVLAFAAAGVITILFSHAAPMGKTPLTFQLGGPSGSGRQTFQPVDWLTCCGDCVNTDYKAQNPWVTNPTTCMWDTDDWFNYNSGGSLAAGASAGINECSYESTSGNDPNVDQHGVIHAGFLDIFAPSPNLQVSETLKWTGGSYTYPTTATWNASRKSYEYKACIFINGVANATWTAVPGSNGGYGVPVNITATITNPTSRSVSNIGATIQYGWQQYYAAVNNKYCPNLGTAFPPPLGS